MTPGAPALGCSPPRVLRSTSAAAASAKKLRLALSSFTTRAWARYAGGGRSSSRVVEDQGRHYLFYSANDWRTADYTVGYAVCETPLGPCAKPAHSPWLAASNGAHGPGGAELFRDRDGVWMVVHGWVGGRVGYPDGARNLFVLRVAFIARAPVALETTNARGHDADLPISRPSFCTEDRMGSGRPQRAIWRARQGKRWGPLQESRHPAPTRHHRCVGPTQAALEVASRFGLAVEQLVILSDSNNVVVWLAPTSVVAKVGTGHHRRLAHELAVAEHLTAVRAPEPPRVS
jgi:hypothetical protein